MGTDGIEYLDGVGRDMDIAVIAETKSRIECQRLNPTIKEVQPEALRTLTLCNKRRHISDRNGVANANVVLLRASGVNPNDTATSLIPRSVRSDMTSPSTWRNCSSLRMLVRISTPNEN